MIQACLNGASVAMTPAELADEAVAAVAAGAQSLHLHPKDGDGRDSMQPGDVVVVLFGSIFTS